ncbi:hypothetical protein FHP22_05655 [Acinetobacter indicus]|uniref:hypothetical protein n=1 Tax=Acinetobacter indicus TaxID=756892 RepID=UPI0012666AD5|nr:hypothetical protein [Acinetobacter indicus]QFS17045.1 hypothetical protein FHP22_05655 [Acinetobacter indicus]
MPLPTAAELTDPNATNTQMKQRLGQLADGVLISEERIISTIKTLSLNALTQTGTLTSPTTTTYTSSDFLAVNDTQEIELTTQSYGNPMPYRFYNVQKVLISETTAGTAYAGVVTERIKVPKGACYVRVMSANNTHQNYVSYNFKLIINVLKSNTYDREFSLDFESFLNTASSGHSGGTSSATYNHKVIPVVGGQVIAANRLHTYEIPSCRVFDKDFVQIAEYSQSSFAIKLPLNAAYVLIQSINKSHANYTADIAEQFYFKRGYGDLLVQRNNEIAAAELAVDLSVAVNTLDAKIEAIKSNGVAKHDISAFTILNTPQAGYVRTPKIATNGMQILYVRGLVGSGVAAIRTYNAAGTPTILLTGSGVNPINSKFVLSEDVKQIEVTVLGPSHANYVADFEPLIILAESEDSLLTELSKSFENKTSNNFPILNKHAWGSATTYDSVYIPYFPGMSLSYSINTSGGGALKINSDNTREQLYKNSATYDFDSYGVFVLSTFNAGHANYNPDFDAKYIIKYETQTENQKVDEFIAGSYLPTPTLKATRDVTFTDGSQRTTIQYLWHDNLGNFFISSALRGDKKFIFKFKSSDFYDSEPWHFSMGFDKFGNIICVYRIEQLSYSAHSDSVRKNPIILLKDQGYKRHVIDFGDGLKPSGWLQNSGFLCTDEYIMLTEYTRPSVASANTWKATYPITDANNWVNVQHFEIGPEVDPPVGIKHIHNVDRDPYTGFVYTSTGDVDHAAAIFVSTDKGSTFSTLLDGSEKYCRVLNWVFTKDWVYWATDSVGAKHWLFKAPRNESGIIDANNIVDVMQFPLDSAATYATIYMPKIHALVFLARSDQPTNALQMELWDLKNNQLVRLDTLPAINNVEDRIGFRCECFEFVPRGNEIACGFSRVLGSGGYRNIIGILGNTSNVDLKVNNIIVTVDRFGDEFTINYDTVVL